MSAPGSAEMTAAEGAEADNGGAARATAEMTALRTVIYRLDRRVGQLESAVWKTGVSVGFITLVAGLFVPFLMSTDDDEDADTITLLGTVFATRTDSDNGGPFSGEAGLLAVLLGILAVGTLIVIGVLFGLWGRRMSNRTLRVNTFLAWTYLVGSIGTWFVVIMLATHFDGVVWLSPATVCFTMGAAITVLLVTKGRDLIESR